MSQLIRKLLSRYFWLGVEGEGDDGGQPDGEGGSTDAGTDAAGTGAADDDFDFDAGDDAATAAPAKPSEAERLAQAERRAEEAERQLAASRQAAPAPTTNRDPEFDAEEQQIAEATRNGASEDTLKWLRWQIQSNRTIRQANRTSQEALNQAREIADRSEFNKLEITKPKVYSAYRDRIESAVADLRSKGQAVPPRMAVLAFLIGQDALAGKMKKTAKPAAAPASTVKRDRLPGTRSDVKASGNASEREKRRARLENINI